MNIRRILMLNGFPCTYLLKENSRSHRSDEPETKTKSVAFIVLPYVCGINEKLKGCRMN